MSRLVLALMLAVALTGCGRKGPLKPADAPAKQEQPVKAN